MMHHYLLIICLLGLFQGFSAFEAAGESGDKPNIIFFFSDDHRHDSLGCAGHPILKTPVIDSLAAKGVRFKNMFVTTSICAASRASVLTGMHERTHRYTFGTKPLRKEVMDISYPVLLKKAGYRTGFVGKFGVNPGPAYTKAAFDSFQPLNRAPYFKKMKDGTMRHLTEIAGDKSIEFIEASGEGQPFCLSVSFNAVHAEDGDKKNHYPWPKAVDGMYDDVVIPREPFDNPEVFNTHPEFMKNSMNRDRYFWRWDTDEKYQKNIRAYFRMISGVDRVIGRVIKVLKEKGLDKNTVIIFAGDNGYYMGNRGFAGKWSHYEESLRVPLVIFDPRVDKKFTGRVLDPVVLNVDIPATMLELAGLKVPSKYSGKSVLSYVQGGLGSADWRKGFFCEHLMNHGKIPKWEGYRGERYVYARYFEQVPVYEYLHDLEKDPKQLKNFANDKSYSEILAKMRKLTDEHRDMYGGKWDKALFIGEKRKK